MAYSDVKDKVLKIIGELNEDCDAEKFCNDLSNLLEYLNLNTSDKDYAYLLIKAWADDVESLGFKVFLNSILLQMPICLVKDNDAFLQIIDIIQSSEQFSTEDLVEYAFFISYRLFVTPALQTDDNKIALWKLSNAIVKKYHDVIWSKENFQYLTKDKRNPNFYVVIADQILQEEHGPTKSALDRCRALITMGKNVLLINTGENCFVNNQLLFYDAVMANHYDDLTDVEAINYQECIIPFCQIGKGIMDVTTLTQYLHIIYEYAPDMVIDIGGNTILGNLCNYFIPVLAVTLGPDNLVRTTEKWQTIGRKITDADRRILNIIGYPEEKVIEMIMTFECKEQTRNISKAELGMNDGDFEIAIVGGRLDDEISPEFIHMMKNASKNLPQIRFDFCGVFKNYDSIISVDDELKGSCRFLGMQSDMMAVFDNIDLYVNPIRLGGGTSAQEAMLKGIPVVTCRKGDVYANCHDDFAVDDYDEMVMMIEKYVNDIDFYKLQSEKALELGELEHNTLKEFGRIIDECHKRDDDNYFRNTGIYLS